MQEGRGVGGREEDFQETEESVERMAGNLNMPSQVSKEEEYARGEEGEGRDNSH